MRYASLLFLVGCVSNDQRCSDLMIQDLVYQYHVRLEDTVATILSRLPRAQRDSAEHRVRYAVVTEWAKRVPGMEATPQDSLYQPVMPVSPADQRWAAEHCYGGRAYQ